MVEERTAAGLVLNQPAGHLEPPESLLAALHRETLEETGWHIQPQGCVGVYQWWRGDRDTLVVRFAFAARPLRQQADVLLDEDIVATHWLTLQQLRKHSLKMRSPLVLRGIEDYLAGRRFPLDLINNIVPEPT